MIISPLCFLNHTCGSPLLKLWRKRGVHGFFSIIFRYSCSIQFQHLLHKGCQCSKLVFSSKHGPPSLEEAAEWLNPIIAGWINYYGKYYKSDIFTLMGRINAALIKWCMNKYKGLKRRSKARRYMIVMYHT